jgi:HEPN domain-containing protein
MKAALLAAGEDYPLIHNLGILNERLAAVDLPEIDRAEADFLTPYAGLPRYGTGPTEVVAKRALELAEKICARLEEIIDEALAKDGPEG